MPRVFKCMAFNNIKKLLKNNIGLHADTVGVSSIERAISHRMSHVGLTSASSYYTLLKKDPKEFGELVEEVVVPETWFFRNKSPFDALRGCLSEMGYFDKGTVQNAPLKILSLPCATGEEPYSIAMALMDIGLSDDDFHVDGIDVSKRALTKARRAIYGQHSFREDEVNIQDRYFKKTRSGFQLLPEVRSHVSFDKANVITDNISPSNEYYDIIFCRNLLIYFERHTQSLVLEKIRHMLKPGGYLFVGHVETTQISKDHFHKINSPKSFGYRRITNAENNKVANNNVGSVDKLKDIYDQLVEVTKKDASLAKNIKSPKAIKTKKISAPFVTVSSWVKVEKLIEEGHYSEATLLCENKLSTDPENADGYYFLGLISNLCGSFGGAESLLKKAIYLAPNHQKALSLSILLAESRGDNEGADYYRRREIKARERNER